jgi:(p)ppGpp synthase/HD superfamily hydrolase
MESTMKCSFSPDVYKQALAFAARAHEKQLVPGTQLPYLVHVVGVAAEVLAAASVESFDVDLALVCALLHDTLEDTQASAAELEAQFGPRVLTGVAALTKNSELPKEQAMADSLRRIVEQPPEVARVKLADRICNLQAPPAHWTRAKCIFYREEAKKIADTLAFASPFLSQRLREKIEAYAAFIPLSSD